MRRKACAPVWHRCGCRKGADNQFNSFVADSQRDAQQNATKGDISSVRSEIAEVRKEVAEVKGEVAEVRGEVALLRKDMEKMELGLRKDMEAMENRLVMRLTKVMLTVTGIALGIVGGVAAVARLVVL